MYWRKIRSTILIYLKKKRKTNPLVKWMLIIVRTHPGNSCKLWRKQIIPSIDSMYCEGIVDQLKREICWKGEWIGNRWKTKKRENELILKIWLFLCPDRCVCENAIKECCAYFFAHPSSLATSQRSILGDQCAQDDFSRRNYL